MDGKTDQREGLEYKIRSLFKIRIQDMDLNWFADLCHDTVMAAEKISGSPAWMKNQPSWSRTIRIPGAGPVLFQFSLL